MVFKKWRLTLYIGNQKDIISIVMIFQNKKIYKGYNYWKKILYKKTLQKRILLIASELSGMITLQEIQLVSGTYKCSTGTLNKILWLDDGKGKLICRQCCFHILVGWEFFFVYLIVTESVFKIIDTYCQP